MRWRAAVAPSRFTCKADRLFAAPDKSPYGVDVLYLFFLFLSGVPFVDTPLAALVLTSFLFFTGKSSRAKPYKEVFE